MIDSCGIQILHIPPMICLGSRWPYKTIIGENKNAEESSNKTLRDGGNLGIVGNIERCRGFQNQRRNLSTEVRIALKIQKELRMDIAENEADTSARYEAEVTSHR